MIQPGEIQSIAGAAGVRDIQIEKDYVISWVIYGIANNPFLKKNLIFKGGTVLKKVYFPDYRFSEDLDFTFIGDFNVETIKVSYSEMIRWVYEESRISLSLKDYTQRETGNFNFYISYTGPLGGAGANKDIKVDISKNELIFYSPEKKEMINPYSDLKGKKNVIRCYTLGEVIAEKMRSLMQRTAPRDIYDLWYLFEIVGNKIEDHVFAFREKAKFKKCNPEDLIEIINRKEKIFAKHWQDHLSDQMTFVPDFNETWRELGKHWRRFQKFIE